MEATPDILKALGDSTRLAIAAMLLKEDCYVELLANRLGLTSATTCHHLKKMEEAGLVTCRRTQFYRMYSLNRDCLGLTLADFLQSDLTRLETDTRDADRQYRDEILSHFLVGGKLTALPAQRKKREVVFAHILRTLQPGTTYPEKEINALIEAYHEDYCTIRREMISLGLLKRDHELYRLAEDTDA